MRFKAMTDEEIDQLNLLPEGLYPYEVIEAIDCISKAGNEQIKLKLNVQGNIVMTYLNDKMPKILKNYCKVNNKMDEYNSESLIDRNCLGDNGGLVHLIIEKGKPILNDQNNANYPDKNAVKDFVLGNNSNIKIEINNKVFNDDIPF